MDRPKASLARVRAARRNAQANRPRSSEQGWQPDHARRPRSWSPNAPSGRRCVPRRAAKATINEPQEHLTGTEAWPPLSAV